MKNIQTRLCSHQMLLFLTCISLCLTLKLCSQSFQIQPSLKHSNAKHSLFVPLMCDSFNFCLCMILIVVVCITEDSLFYVSSSLFMQFNCFASNQGNIKLQAPNFYYNFFQFTSFKKKLKPDFKICEKCFSRFYADINTSRIIRNLQYLFFI